MRSEQEIRAVIQELEEKDDPLNDAYLDEGEQAQLAILEWVLEETDSRP